MTSTYQRRHQFLARLAICAGLGLVGGGLLAVPFSGSDDAAAPAPSTTTLPSAPEAPPVQASSTTITAISTVVAPGSGSPTTPAAATTTTATASVPAVASTSAPDAGGVDSTSSASTAATTVATLAPPPAVQATAYALFDVGSGAVLAEQSSAQQLSVGSMQKLLTAYVVMQAGDPEKSVTVPPLNTGALESAIGLRQGETYPRSLLMRAMLVVSANDAARTLAIDVAGSEQAFVAQMNAAAASLGLVDTFVANPVGLDADGQHSSAADMGRLAMVLLQDPTFRETISRPSAKLHGITFPATNSLLRLYAGADGVKTGHTTLAQWCIAGSATRDGRQLLAVVLGAPSEAARTGGAAALLDWGFANT